MIGLLSIRCYVPPSVEVLGPTSLSVFKPGPTTPRLQSSNQDPRHPQFSNQDIHNPRLQSSNQDPRHPTSFQTRTYSTPVFKVQTRTHDTPSFQTRLTPLPTGNV